MVHCEVFRSKTEDQNSSLRAKRLPCEGVSYVFRNVSGNNNNKNYTEKTTYMEERKRSSQGTFRCNVDC